MSAQTFVNEYRKIYALLQHELMSHTCQCQADDCKDFGDGFKKAFAMLPKPPPNRKNK